MDDDILIWNEDSEKWSDRMNDHFCARSFTKPGYWEVRARYGFVDGDRTKYFDTEDDALGYLRVYLAVKYA